MQCNKQASSWLQYWDEIHLERNVWPWIWRTSKSFQFGEVGRAQQMEERAWINHGWPDMARFSYAVRSWRQGSYLPRWTRSMPDTEACGKYSMLIMNKRMWLKKTEYARRQRETVGRKISKNEVLNSCELHYRKNLCLLGQQFSKCCLQHSGHSWGKNSFHKNAKTLHLFFFLSFSHKCTMEFSIVYMAYSDIILKGKWCIHGNEFNGCI